MCKGKQLASCWVPSAFCSVLWVGPQGGAEGVVLWFWLSPGLTEPCGMWEAQCWCPADNSIFSTFPRETQWGKGVCSSEPSLCALPEAVASVSLLVLLISPVSPEAVSMSLGSRGSPWLAGPVCTSACRHCSPWPVEGVPLVLWRQSAYCCLKGRDQMGSASVPITISCNLCSCRLKMRKVAWLEKAVQNKTVMKAGHGPNTWKSSGSVCSSSALRSGGPETPWQPATVWGAAESTPGWHQSEMNRN